MISTNDVREILGNICRYRDVIGGLGVFCDEDMAVSADRSNSGRWTHGFLKQQLREHFIWLTES